MRNKGLLFLVIILLLSRLLFIGSGLNVLEPDEWDYQNIAQSLETNPWPVWHDKPYLEKHFSFIYIAYYFGKAFPWLFTIGPYVNLRLISVLADLGLLISSYFILKKLSNDQKLIISTLLFFIFIPLHWFYARSGTYEVWFSFFSSIFLLSFMRWKANPLKQNSYLMGLIWGLAVLAKHINVLFLILPLVYFINFYKDKKIKAYNFISFCLASFLVLLIGLLPVLWQWSEFINQYIGVPQSFFILNPKAFLAIWLEYLKKSWYWLSPPVLILIGLGLIRLFQKRINYILLVFLVCCIYLGIYYVTPRSFFILIPLLPMIMLYALEFIDAKLSVSKFNLIIILFFLTQIPFSLKAYDSTRHYAFEKAKKAIIKYQKENPNFKVYTTIDPIKVTRSFPFKVDYLNQQASSSAIILADRVQSELMFNFSEAQFKIARSQYLEIEKNYQAKEIIYDPYPHFPTSLKDNVFKIFILP